MIFREKEEINQLSLIFVGMTGIPKHNAETRREVFPKR